MSYIIAEDIQKRYGTGQASVLALHDVSFEIEAGEFVGVMGESGAGKSTLLTIMGALTTPSSGTYVVDGIDVYGLGQERRADFRREFLGFVFQSFHLVPYLNVLENVMLPLAPVRANSRKKRILAEGALDHVGLQGKGRRLPGEVSGGEKERAAIARAIVNEFLFLLADEPTGNLDSRTTEAIMGLFRSLNEEGMTIIMVTHDSLCAGYAHRILHMKDGRLV